MDRTVRFGFRTEYLVSKTAVTTHRQHLIAVALGFYFYAISVRNGHRRHWHLMADAEFFDFEILYDVHDDDGALRTIVTHPRHSAHRT